MSRRLNWEKANRRQPRRTATDKARIPVRLRDPLTAKQKRYIRYLEQQAVVPGVDLTGFTKLDASDYIRKLTKQADLYDIVYDNHPTRPSKGEG